MKNNSQKKGGVFLSYISMGLNVLVKFLYTPILLRLLGQAEYGLYSLVISIVGYLAILDLGFGSTVTRYTVKYKEENDKKNLYKLYGTFSVIYIIIGLLALCVCMGLYTVSSSIFGQSMTVEEISKFKLMIFLCGINLSLSFPLQISSSVLIAYERFIFKNGVNLIKIIAEPFVIVLLLYFVHIDSVGAIVVVTIFNLLGYLVYYLYALKKLDFRFSIKYFDKTLIKQLISFSISMFLLMLFEQLQFNTGQFVLGMYYGTEVVAIWGIAMIFVLNYRSISSAITNVFMPSYLSFSFNDDRINSTNLITKMTRIQTLMLSFIFFNFIIFGREFIIFWAGDNYVGAYYVALIIMTPMTLSLILDFCYMHQLAKKNFKFRIISFYIGLIVSFVLVLFIFKVTIITYAIFMAITIILSQIYGALYYERKNMNINLKLILFNLLKIIAIPIFFLLIFFLLNHFVLQELLYECNRIFSLFLRVVVFNAIILPIFWFTSLDEHERKILKLR